MIRKKNKILNNVQRGFTLLEILLVIALIAILAGIIIVAINPAKQLAAGRNVQRQSDVATILDATYQYMIDNQGTLPGDGASPDIITVPPIAACATDPVTTCNGKATGVMEICVTGGSCSGLISLTDLTAAGKYITAMPLDPSGSSTNGTGYYMCQDSTTHRITVCAPSTETTYGAKAIYATK